MILGLVDPEREYVEPTTAGEFARLRFETRRLPGARDFGVPAEPRLLGRGRSLAHRATDGSDDAGQSFEYRIHFEEAIVVRHAARVEQDLDDTEAFVDRIQRGLAAPVEPLLLHVGPALHHEEQP